MLLLSKWISLLTMLNYFLLFLSRLRVNKTKVPIIMGDSVLNLTILKSIWMTNGLFELILHPFIYNLVKYRPCCFWIFHPFETDLILEEHIMSDVQFILFVLPNLHKILYIVVSYIFMNFLLNFVMGSLICSDIFLIVV